MKTATLLTATSKIVCAGLLMLAGVLFSAHYASAQTDETCPLPAGVAPVEPPDVTAEQVENGTGSLMDFALSARDRLREQAQQAVTAGSSQYFACLIRQDESAWRSGSTYLVTLTPDGRVYIHAKDMSLSGAKLRPAIYTTILQALGIDPAVLGDPVATRAAFAAAEANSRSFDIPGIPGASGYASTYTSLRFRNPAILLAGFDLNATHLADEQIDYGDPAVTAADVVDRATLKAFVTEAGNYFMGLVKTGNQATVSQARIAMRDPDGPWRHGSVYLYIWNLTSQLILFHAGFPERYELTPLYPPRAHDAVTGEPILPQLVEATKRGPEGGFVEYHFDDPNDDNDSADIPKVGYVRTFSDQVQRADGSTAQISFVVGSGFYRTASQEVAAGRNTVVQSVLPQVVRAMTAGTVDAVSSRIQRASSGAAPDASLSFGGATTLSDAIVANGPALQNGTFDLARLLEGSSFTVALGAADGGSSGPFGDLTFWGSGDYRSLSGGNAQSVSYDGTVTSANLGIDTRLSADVLAGVSLTSSQGAVDYTDLNAQEGEFSASLTSVNPYIGWGSPGGMTLWAMAGYGTGEVEIDDAVGTEASDLTQQTFAAGASGSLLSSDEFLDGGTTSLLLKAEAAFTKAEVDGSETLARTTVNVSRQRLMLEGVYDRKLASGATLSPSLELGIRNDGGDGETGGGVETGGGLRYSDPASGLTIEGRARTLLSHGGDHEEWGVSGLVRIDPGASGQGLAFSLRPAWGETAGGVRRLWGSDVTALGAAAAEHGAGRLSARLAYGIGDTWGAEGVLTPYTDVSLSDAGSRRLGLGGRYDIGPWVGMSLEGVHGRPAQGAADHSVMLRADLRW